jgi:heterodisulfide reductase subunit A-like polyferredoxin
MAAIVSLSHAIKDDATQRAVRQLEQQLRTAITQINNFKYLATLLSGCDLEAVRVSFGGSGAATLVDTGQSYLVAGVTKTAAGRYTFQLNAPYPAKMVAIIPKLTCVAANGVRLEARYVEGSFSGGAGTFEIDISDNTPTAVDPTSGTALDVLVVFKRE